LEHEPVEHTDLIVQVSRDSGSAHGEVVDIAWGATVAIIVVATIVRLIVGARLPLVPDETYYWEWSRHLSFGYFDHPPMIAGLIRIGTMVFGNHPIGVRVLPIICGGFAALAIAATARRVGGTYAAAEAAIIISVMPLAAAGLVLATPDASLLAAVAVAIYFIVAAIQTVPRSRESLRAWVGAGIALGFAFASKYTSIFLPVGVLIAFVSHRALRPRFAEWGPYAACVIATVIFLPVLIWNDQHHWISFTYQIEHGLGSNAGSLLRSAWRHEGDLLGGQAGLATPILFVLIAIAVAKSLRPRLGPERWVLAVVSSLYFVFFVYSALKKHVEPNWPAPAYIGGVVLCAAYEWSERAKKWRAAGIALAGVFSLAVYVHAFRPIFPIPPAKDPVARAFGWGALADATARAAAVPRARPHPGSKVWISADRYQDASEIAYHSTTHVETFALNIGGRPNQYDLWPGFPSRAFPGDRLVVALDETQGPHPTVVTLGPYFESILRGELVELRRGDAIIAVRRLYTLDGWRGGWPR
jgi:4-amino-4-deoxy-L-arabinose transferase-like glycosyltransferase